MKEIENQLDNLKSAIIPKMPYDVMQEYDDDEISIKDVDGKEKMIVSAAEDYKNFILDVDDGIIELKKRKKIDSKIIDIKIKR